MSYAAPVWIEALEKKHNTIKMQRMQRLINIKIAKAFRTTSNSALCVITGIKPITIELKEIASLYKISKGYETNFTIDEEGIETDSPVDYKKGPHLADSVTIKHKEDDKVAV